MLLDCCTLPNIIDPSLISSKQILLLKLLDSIMRCYNDLLMDSLKILIFDITNTTIT